jgi:diguanylate cyclase (GGDEF)-like protein/PAS domain S-box-containing protein
LQPKERDHVSSDIHELRRELKIVNIALRNSLDAILVHTLDGRVLFFNDVACAQRGLTRDEYAAMPPWGFSGDYAPGERAERTARLKELGSMVFRSSRAHDGEVRTSEIHARYVEGDEGDEPVIVAVTHDVTDQIRAEEILKHQAFHDALTGLANRALFEDRLSLAIAGAQRHGHILGIAYIDVDEFKAVNDRFGHDVGDRVLVALGERIERSVRQIDTAARFGGDEFVVLFPELSSDKDLERVIRKLGARLCEPVMVDGVSLEVTASIGSALFDTANDDARSLIMRADIAMYEAKRIRAAERNNAR